MRSRIPRLVSPVESWLGALRLGMGLLALAAAPAQAQDFGYSGDLGPDHWAELDPA